MNRGCCGGSPIAPVLGLALLLALPVAAQYLPPVRQSGRDLALAAMTGRFRSPVQCRLRSGEQIAREEAVVFKLDPTAGSGRTGLRATFFGIDAADAEGCFNLLERRLPDRRGTLYLHVRGLPRPDLGAADLRRMLADGELTYHIHRGELSIRPIGETTATPERIRFGGGDQRMEVRAVVPGTDAHKLLEQFLPASDQPKGGAALRRLSLSFFGPGDLRFDLHALEDPDRSAPPSPTRP